MSIWILISLLVGVVHLAGLLTLVGCALWAPEGYEDAEGFHLGSPPAPRTLADERAMADQTLGRVA